MREGHQHEGGGQQGQAGGKARGATKVNAKSHWERGEDRGPHNINPPGHNKLLLRKEVNLTGVLEWSGGHRDLVRLDAHSTCPAHGWPGAFQST
jgi:hypothetical protein